MPTFKWHGHRSPTSSERSPSPSASGGVPTPRTQMVANAFASLGLCAAPRTNTHSAPSLARAASTPSADPEVRFSGAVPPLNRSATMSEPPSFAAATEAPPTVPISRMLSSRDAGNNLRRSRNRSVQSWRSGGAGAGSEEEREAERVLNAVIGVNPRTIHRRLSSQQAALEVLRAVTQEAAATSIQAIARAALARKEHLQRMGDNGASSKAKSDDGDGFCLVFGALNMDLKAESATKWHGSSARANGQFFSQPGGRGGNEAVALARLGVGTALVGRVGNDEIGEQLQNKLLAEAHLACAVSMGEEATGVAVQLVTTKDHGKATVTCHGANDAVGDHEVEAAVKLLDRHGAAARRKLLVQLELPGEPTRKVAEAAKQRGYQVVLKASPPDLTKAFHVLASGAVDVLFVNEVEALKLLDIKSETPVITAREAKKAAKDLMEKWRSVEMVVVKCLFGTTLLKRGGDGDEAEQDEQVLLSLPQNSNHDVVDPIGAADAFPAGFVAAQARGLELEQALLWGYAAGCLSTMKRGAQDSMPRTGSLEHFLAVELAPARAPHLATAPWSQLDPEHRTLLQQRNYLGQQPLHLAAMRSWAADVANVLDRTLDAAIAEDARRAEAAVEEAETPRPVSAHGSFEEGTAEVPLAFHEMLAKKIQVRDAFGLTPLQRAYECYMLVQHPQHQKARASSLCVLRLLCAARLILAATGHLPPLSEADDGSLVEASQDHDGYSLSSMKPAASEAEILANGKLAGDLWPYGAPDCAGAPAPAAACAVINLLALATPELGKGADPGEQRAEAMCKLVALLVLPVLKLRGGGEQRRAAARLRAFKEAHFAASTTQGEGAREGVNLNGCTLLLVAARTGDTALVEELLQHGMHAQLHLELMRQRSTEAAQPSRGPKTGFDPLARSDAGDTALHLAAEQGHLSVCELLVTRTTLHLTEDRNAIGQTAVNMAPEDLEVRDKLKGLHTVTLLERYRVARSKGVKKRCVVANDTKMDRRVALKFVDDPESAHHEHHVITSVNSGGSEVGPVVYEEPEYCTDSKKTLLVMELGEPLAVHTETFYQKHLAKVMLECVEALHDRDFVHNDIKFTHFLQFGVTQTPKLIDFDQAQTEGTEMTAICTDRYAAPEVMKAVRKGGSMRCSAAGDVWAMAMVLVQLFAGKPMFEDSEIPQLVEKLVSPDAKELAKHLDKRLKLLHQSKLLNDAMLDLLVYMLGTQDPKAPCSAEKRPTVHDVLAKSFFLEAERTSSSKEIEVLALFSSPTKRQNGRPVPGLQLMKEVQALTESMPQSKVIVKAAAEFPGSVEKPIQTFSPRLIQFSGHGNAVQSGVNAGALAFELEDGTLDTPAPDEFIALLRKCPRLEGVFLNGCMTLRLPKGVQSLGEHIHEVLPHLTVIGWETISEDKAATCFAKGFYDALATQYHNGRLQKRVSLEKAYKRAEEAFLREGFRKGDPEPLQFAPRAIVMARTPAGSDGAVRYEVKLKSLHKVKSKFAPGVLTLQGEGVAEEATVTGVAADPAHTLEVGKACYIMSVDAAPVKLTQEPVHGTPGLLVGRPETVPASRFSSRDRDSRTSATGDGRV